LLRERSLEQRAVFGDTLELLEQLVDRQVHFDVGLDRAERLLFERAGAAVPHEDLAEGRIDDRGRAAAELLHAMADAARLAVADAAAIMSQRREALERIMDSPGTVSGGIGGQPH